MIGGSWHESDKSVYLRSGAISMSGSLEAMVADRIAGLRYAQIAERHGTSVTMVRHKLRRAMMKGLVSAEAIRYKPLSRRPAMPDGEYHAKWMRRVLNGIEIDAAGCWLWKGFCDEAGYSKIPYRKGSKTGHRLMYQIMNGVSLTRWQLVMHKCDVRNCINPAHLQIGTPHDNVQDAANKGRHHNARKTECKRGHVYTEKTVYITPAGTRACLVCKRARMRMNAGWPEHLAYSDAPLPLGVRPVKGKWPKKRNAA
jgi:hypothetical protein